MSKGKANFTLPGASRQAFANRLKTLLSKRGAVPRLSKTIGASPSAIRKWIAGETEPSRDYIVALSEAMRVNIAWLCAEKGPQFGDTDAAPLHSLAKEINAIDVTALEITINFIEQWLQEREAVLSPEKKAAVIVAAYECVIETQDIHNISAYEDNLCRLLRVAV